jgi:hypothetical protein
MIKYFTILIFFCLLISIVFITIKNTNKKEKFYTDKELDLILYDTTSDECKNKKNLKDIKENYYTDDELDLILYDTTSDGCDQKTYKGLIHIDPRLPISLGVLEDYVIPKEYESEYNLNDPDKNIFGKDMLPKITDQAKCGCCYAHTTVTLIYYNLKTTNPSFSNSLSIKHFIDCSSLESNLTTCPKSTDRPCKGCDGCNTEIIFRYYFNSPRTLYYENCYKSDDLKCTIGTEDQKKVGSDCGYEKYKLYRFVDCDSSASSCVGKKIVTPRYDLIKINLGESSDVIYKLPPNKIEFIKKIILRYGPVQFSYNGVYSSFSRYSDGICNIGYAPGKDPKESTHSLLIIGWKDVITTALFFKKTTTKCWIVRNSWGNGWGVSSYSGGEKGYVFFPIDLNIFYGTGGKVILSAISEQRLCIPPYLSLNPNGFITSLIQITKQVEYSKNKSTVTIKALAYLGVPLIVTTATFTINAIKIDGTINHIDEPPQNAIQSGPSVPQFYVVNNSIITDTGGVANHVIQDDKYYFSNPEGKITGNFDININRFFVFTLDINMQKLLYNTQWSFGLNFVENRSKQILSNSSISIEWDLKINIIERGKYNLGDGTPISFIKFDVLVPITENFNLMDDKNIDIETFPNNNIFADTVTGNPNFIPGTGTSNLPLIPGKYYYINNTYLIFYTLSKKFNFFDSSSSKQISVNSIP